MKNYSLRVFLLALALTVGACGSGSDSSDNEADKKLPDTTVPDTTPNEITYRTITAIDGYLSLANVFADTNDNLILDDTDKMIGETNSDAKFDVASTYDAHAIFIQAVPGVTVDSERGLVQESFILSALPGSDVISPFTSLVVDTMKADTNLSQINAEEQVLLLVEAITEDKDLVFSDYLAEIHNEAVALNVVGEYLVDSSDESLERKEEVAKHIAQEIIEQPLTDEGYIDLNAWSDLNVKVPDSVVPGNEAPYIISEVPAKHIYYGLGDDFIELDLATLFSDDDPDEPLNFNIKQIESSPSNVNLENRPIYNNTHLTHFDLENTGLWGYEIMATDSYGSTSSPLYFRLEVVKRSENGLVVPLDISSAIEKTRQELYALDLTEGQEIDYTIDLSELFYNPENTEMTYGVTSNIGFTDGVWNGFSFSYEDGILRFTGKLPSASAANKMFFEVSASNGAGPLNTGSYVDEDGNSYTILPSARSVSFNLPEIKEDPNWELELSRTIKVNSGRMTGARLYRDNNNDGMVSSGDKIIPGPAVENIAEQLVTDENGEFTITPLYFYDALLAVGGLDSVMGDTSHANYNRTLSAFAGSRSITPLTTLAVNYFATGEYSSQEEAKQAVINDISSISTDESLIFGDYHEVDSVEARGLTMLGHYLTHYNSLGDAYMIALTPEIVTALNANLANNFGDYDTSVDIDIPMLRPYVNVPPVLVADEESYKLNRIFGIGDEFDTNIMPAGFKLDFFITDETVNGLEIHVEKISGPDSFDGFAKVESSSISEDAYGKINAIIRTAGGVASVAGDYVYGVYVTDEYGARSNSVELTYKVVSDNKPTTVNVAAVAVIQAELDAMTWYSEQDIGYSIPMDKINALFEDEDDWFTVDHISVEFSESDIAYNTEGFPTFNRIWSDDYTEAVAYGFVGAVNVDETLPGATLTIKSADILGQESAPIVLTLPDIIVVPE